LGTKSFSFHNNSLKLILFFILLNCPVFGGAYNNKCIIIKISDLNYRYYKRQYGQFGKYWTLELFKNGKYIIQITEKDNIGWTQEKILDIKNQLDILKVLQKEFTFW